MRDNAMAALIYASGEDVKRGDRILLHGEPGEVEFVVTEITGDAALDWFLEQGPGRGVMIRAKAFGRVFLAVDAISEDVQFVSRGDGC